MAFRGLVARCNLLLGESNVLKNRYLHVEWQDETVHSRQKEDIKQYIGTQNSILTVVEQSKCARKTKNNIVQLYQAFGLEKIFGRSDVLNVLSITVSPASTLLKKMVKLGVIESVHGMGKGKYRFVNNKR